VEDCLEVIGAQVRAEKALHVSAHLLEAGGAAEFAKIQPQINEGGDHRQRNAGDQQQVDHAIHVSLQRSKRLS
jgi:hypothetical protein